MANSVFEAPTLYEAAPDPAEGYLHESAELGAELARRKRPAVWLRERLLAKGVAASALVWDESGWAWSVNGKNGFVAVILDFAARPFTLAMAGMSGAKAEYQAAFAAFEAILRESAETTLLRIDG